MEQEPRLHFTISTPYGDLHSGPADYLRFATPDGERGIRAGHENALFYMDAGEIAVKSGKARLSFRVSGGLLSLAQNRAVLLTGFAARAEEYEKKHAEHSKALESHYSEEMKSAAELQRAQMALRRSLTQEP